MADETQVKVTTKREGNEINKGNKTPEKDKRINLRNKTLHTGDTPRNLK